jgi:hypothetical protein
MSTQKELEPIYKQITELLRQCYGMGNQNAKKLCVLKYRLCSNLHCQYLEVIASGSGTCGHNDQDKHKTCTIKDTKGLL